MITIKTKIATSLGIGVVSAIVAMSLVMSGNETSIDDWSQPKVVDVSKLTMTGVIGPNNIRWGISYIDDSMQLLVNTHYSVGYHTGKRVPLWVSHQISQSSIGDIKRRNDFRQDVRIPRSARSTNEDYRKSGYDRGHLAPAADFSGVNIPVMSESFLLSNMAPQVPWLNRQLWNRIEKSVRDNVTSNPGTVAHIFTGTTFNKLSPKAIQIGISIGNVSVPYGFWKTVVYVVTSKDSLGKTTQMLDGEAFYCPNDTVAWTYEEASAFTIDDIEKLTSNDLYFLLPDSLENIVESR